MKKSITKNCGIKNIALGTGKHKFGESIRFRIGLKIHRKFPAFCILNNLCTKFIILNTFAKHAQIIERLKI